jgi:hypothetical protein
MKLAGPAGNPESLPARAGQFLPNYPQIGSDTLRAEPSRVSPGVPSGYPDDFAIIAIPRPSPSQATSESLVERPLTDSLEAVQAGTASFQKRKPAELANTPIPWFACSPAGFVPRSNVGLPEPTQTPSPQARDFPGDQRACMPTDAPLDTRRRSDCDHVVRESAVQESRTW